MATIPTGQKFHTVPSNVVTQERGSALANSQREIYTMQDIIDTVGDDGGGGGGIHGAMIRSGSATTYIVNSLTSYSATSTTNLRLAAVPFIPIKTFTTASFYINVGTSQVAAIARILIYSELNGLPDQKLYESANLDLSSSGIKTATTSFTFTAGTTYFVCTHTQGTAGVTHIPATSLMPISIGGISTPTTFFSSTVSWAIGSAPTTFGSVNSLNGAAILVGITSA